MPIQTVNEIKIYYEQYGQGDDLILIGGLTADHQVWKSTIRLLSPHFRISVFDNRGAGRSDSPDYPYTSEMMANDTVQLMDALNISRAHIIGHSMGGCIAQKILLMAPEKVNRCVLVCSRAKPNPVANMILSMREKLQANGITDDLLAEYVMPFLFSADFLNQSAQLKGFIQWTLQNPFPQSAAGFKNQLHAVKTHDISGELHQITTPTFVIAGAEDILMPAVDAEIFSKSLKNSVFLSIPHCAHMPHVEKSAAFTDAVLSFLNHT